MEVSRRVPAVRSLKPVLVKPKGTRQALGGITNNRILSNVTNKASVKNEVLNEKKHEILKPLKAVRRGRSACVPQIKEVPTKDISTYFEAFSTTNLPLNVVDIDSEDSSNPQLVSRYVNDIYKYMRLLEAKYPVKSNYLEGQTEITGKMRSVLVDWLIQVHIRFQLLQETLYLCISMIDRFLQVEKVKRTKLQLVGVTAMFIAAKYEEMFAPELGDFVYITDNSYDCAEILRMEQVILRKLDFNLGKPLPLHFLRRNSKAGNVDASMHTLAKYLMEIVLPEYELVHHPPSIIAAAALYLSMKLLENSQWNETLTFYSGYNEKEILPIVSSLCKILIKSEKSKLQAVHKKYASSKLMKISTISELTSSVVKDLAEGLY